MQRLSEPFFSHGRGFRSGLLSLYTQEKEMKDTKKAADFWVSILVIAISIVFFIQASAMPGSERGIGPGDYPKVICYVLFALGFIQLVTTVVRSRGIPLIDFSSINIRYLLRALIMLILIFIYYKLMRPVGFLITTPVFLFASFILFGYRKKAKAAAVALIFSVAVYFLFTKVFLVILPRGILG